MGVSTNSSAKLRFDRRWEQDKGPRGTGRDHLPQIALNSMGCYCAGWPRSSGSAKARWWRVRFRSWSAQLVLLLA